MISRAALAGIYFYQHKISPRKGYRCAYSVLHGGTGCSGFAKAAIREHGVVSALGIIRKRFQDCKHARMVLQSQSKTGDGAEDADDPDKKPKNRKCENCIDRWVGCCDMCSFCGRFVRHRANDATNTGKSATDCDCDCDVASCDATCC